MLLFLLFGVVSGACTGELTFGVTGIDPLYDGDTTSLWAGACGYTLRWCPWGGPNYVIWTIVEKSTGIPIQTLDSIANAYGKIDFCFSPGQATLSNARDYCVQTTVNQVVYSSVMYYARQTLLGITKPLGGSTITAGGIFDLIYTFDANAPAQNIVAYAYIAFTNTTNIMLLERSFIDNVNRPGIGFVQQVRMPVSIQPGSYCINAGLLDLYKREMLVRPTHTRSSIFNVVCPNPPCNNVPFPPAPPPVPVVIQTPAIQPPPPAPTSKASSVGLF